jgi:large subunit ribosomal protein L18
MIIKRGKSKAAARIRRQVRGRKKVSGSPERPASGRVSLDPAHRSPRSSTTPRARPSRRASTMESDLRAFDGDKTAKAKKVGELIAERAKAPVSRPSSSTVVATSTTAGSRRSPTVRAREGSPVSIVTPNGLTEMRNH